MSNLKAASLLGLMVLTLGCGEGPDAEAGNEGAGAAGGASSASGGSGGTGGVSAGDVGGSADPLLCGGAYGSECAEGKVCVFDSGCGTVGHCTRMNPSCDNVYEPVCGCDGATYGNACSARAAGVSPAEPGECAALYPCGPYKCGTSQYCLDKADDAKGPWRYACLALPAQCSGTSSCACLADTKGCFSGFTCTEDSGTATITCK